jgi:hypothetical protein
LLLEEFGVKVIELLTEINLLKKKVAVFEYVKAALDKEASLGVDTEDAGLVSGTVVYEVLADIDALFIAPALNRIEVIESMSVSKTVEPAKPAKLTKKPDRKKKK